MKTTKKNEKKKDASEQEHSVKQKKSKFVRYWEANQGREPWFEIVDMRAVLK